MTAEGVLALVCVAQLAVLVVALYRQDRERAAWTRERSALLERCVPGLGLAGEPAEAGPVPAYGTDVYEWQVERERLGAGEE